MDIFNRPPTIAEDTIVYTLHPDAPHDKTTLTTLSALIYSYVTDTLLPPSHIWHRDSFQLRVDSDAKVIEGTMRVGDCVDDEWCTVWLLFQISRKFDVAISVYDSDGEFLLIEAAEHIPKWLTPENANNRVWIYQSHLHLIPLEHISPSAQSPNSRRKHLPGRGDSDAEDDFDSETYISVEHALRLVRDSEVDTRASEAVEAAIQRKIRGYPGVIRQHAQRTKAFIPSDIVLALSQNPSLVQKAVEAFYTRDALQLRVVSKMSRFPPNSSVIANVTMTRTAYAQLMGQKFHPPKVFGRWTEPEGSPEWRWKDIGMKLACGFEMLYAENKSRVNTNIGPESSEALKDALRRDPAYTAYLDSLRRAGYFPEGKIEGSAQWNERETKAAKIWVEARKNENTNRPSFTALVDDAVSRAASIKDSILEAATTGEEDADDWLNVSPEDLEKTLAGTSAMDVDLPPSGIEEVDEEKTQADRLSKLAEKVEKFVEGKGDLEGARFEDDLLSDDEAEEDLELSDPPTSDDDDDDAGDSEEGQARRQKALDSLVAPLDPSDYGHLPPLDSPSKSNATQKTAPVTMETETRTLPSGEVRKIRQPILMRNKFDGVDSDDESDEDEEDDVPGALQALSGESDEEAPQVVGGISHDIDINMEAEEEEFLKFSREALGISDSMWTDIVNERKGRGAFVPEQAPKGTTTATSPAPETLSSKTEAKLKGKANQFFDAIADDDSDDGAPVQSKPEPLPPSQEQPRIRNPNLDSFEAVMEAMEVELQKSRQARKDAKGPPKPKASSMANPETSKAKGKKKAVVFEDEDGDDEDDETAMDAELRTALRREDDAEEVEEAGMDYNLIKNFLESFKSQGGLSGPVSSLAGRLEPGWKLPRDSA